MTLERIKNGEWLNHFFIGSVKALWTFFCDDVLGAGYREANAFNDVINE